MTEEDLRELFREMREEPVPPDSQARVRLAVAERARSWRERFRKYWKVAAAALVPACAVLIAVLSGGPARIEKPAVVPSPIAEQAETPAIVPAPENPAPRVVRARRRIARAVRQPVTARSGSNEHAASVIRIETPDPNVVILLVGG